MLVAGHWAENRKRYLLALLAMGGLLTAWYGLLLSMDQFGPLNLFLQYATYYIGIYFVGCFYASTIFAELGNRSRAIQYLSIPASHLEKLLCGILFGVVFFFLAYTVVFYLVDIPMVSLANRVIAREHQHWPGSYQPIGNIDVFKLWNAPWAPIGDRKFHLLLLGYFILQSAFLLGSVYFARWNFIKTVVAILLFWVLFVIFMSKGIEDHIPNGWHSFDFFRWIDSTDNTVSYGMVTLPGSMEKILIFLMQFGLPPILWVITYFRLKEKEV
jgi:hypothetical protein